MKTYWGVEVNANTILVGNPKWQSQLGIHKFRWDDNIKMYLKRKWAVNMYWIYLTQYRDQWRDIVNTVMNLQVPYKAGYFLTR
jgi:hypothetical protein